MKLLIITQAVDREDPVLGFFTRWLEEFAKHAESIEVICLKEGKHDLPENVRVHSLGKERGASRVGYVLAFYRYIVALRYRYDSVFVHMNPEYVILGGVQWRMWGKRVALWYTHKNVDLKLRIAEKLVHVIFTASKESFRLSSRKVRVMGHGIDVEYFNPDPHAARSNAILSVGRLSPAKRHDLIIRAAAQTPYPVWVVGDGPERGRLEALARDLGIADRVRFFGGHAQEELRDEYRRAGVFAHTSETGSLDKVVLEALACGLPVVSTSRALSGLPITVVPTTPEGLAGGIKNVGHADPKALARYVREHHSLARLIPAILAGIEKA